MATDFGNRLKLARKDAGLTQVELAKLAGLSQSTVAELERSGYGSAKVTLIAQACGVSAQWLATGEGPMRTDHAHAVPAPAQPPTLAEALSLMATALSMADDLTRIQAEPLLQRLARQPEQAQEIAARLLTLLDGERLPTTTHDILNRKKAHA